MTCANAHVRRELGFEQQEADRLCHHWHRATTTCLELGSYRAMHTRYAVQAIATLNMCAHILGHSNEQFVLAGEAIKMSQSLGLHLIRTESIEILSSSSEEDRQVVLNNEVNRRLFCQLCVQDWFSMPSTGVSTVHPREFITGKPDDRDYLTMERLSAGEPTYVSYNNYLYDIATLIADLCIRLARCNTDFTRYETVMLADSRVRDLATKGRPPYFDVTVGIDPAWPYWMPWARRSLTIAFAHKIIIIHRSFLARSFSNANFAHSRKSCVAAAKTIINEASRDRDETEPIIWIDQVRALYPSIDLILISQGFLHRRRRCPSSRRITV